MPKSHKARSLALPFVITIAACNSSQPNTGKADQEKVQSLDAGKVSPRIPSTNPPEVVIPVAIDAGTHKALPTNDAGSDVNALPQGKPKQINRNPPRVRKQPKPQPIHRNPPRIINKPK